jgi:peptidoglycan hydrolase CwlO-like protein
MEDGYIMELLTGPFSALVLAVILLWGLYKLAAKYLPKIIERHVQMIDDLQETQSQITSRLEQLTATMTEQHASQTESMRKAIAGIHQRLNPIQDDIKEVKFKLGLEAQINDE